MALAGYLADAIAGQREQLQHFWRTPAPAHPNHKHLGGDLRRRPARPMHNLLPARARPHDGRDRQWRHADVASRPLPRAAIRLGTGPFRRLSSHLRHGCCCAFGCIVRGLATSVVHVYIGSAIIGLGASNLWVSVLSHISQHTEPSKREACVSAFVFQVATLRIVAKGAFFPCVWLLERCGVSSLFMRYRVMMVSCPCSASSAGWRSRAAVAPCAVRSRSSRARPSRRGPPPRRAPRRGTCGR